MDSCKSGSVQSSSGGNEEEYDSHGDSISAFLNNNPSSHIGHHHLVNQQPPQPPPPQQHHQYHSHSSSALFDPLSTYFDQRPPQLTTNPNPLDAVWFKNQRSEPGCSDLGGFIASSSSTQSRATTLRSSVSAITDQPNNNNNNNNMVRNPKKRSRASRRAPTTVLTTDTTNFRAMVQEFTGIPAPPFTTSLHLFGRSTQIDPFRPAFVNNNTTSSSTPNYNYQLPSDQLGLLKQHQNLLNINMQNPILNLQSLLQNPPKYPLPNSTIPSNDSSSLKMDDVLQEFGLSGQGHVKTNLSWGDQEHDQSLVRSINGNYNSNSQRVSNGKVNRFSASSSDFNGDKGPENVASYKK